MKPRFSAIFENTLGGIISSLVIFFLLPTATLVQAQSESVTTNFMWFSSPTFIASLVISVFLVVLFQFCRKLYQENKKLHEKSVQLETFLVSVHYKTEVIGKISSVRNRALFLKQFDHIEYFKVPGESEEELWSRLPQGGLYYQHLFDEYQEVRKWCEKTYRDKSGKEIDAMLKRFYPPEFYNPSVLNK